VENASTDERNEMKWYFGWNIVGAAATLTLLSVGMRLGIGPFFLPIAHDLGFSRSLLASIIAVGMICYGLGMPLAGQLIARRGTRFTLVAGILIVLAATTWALHAHTATSFLLSFGVLLSLGLSFVSPVAFTPVISRWFSRQRGMALFFLSTGSMAGMAIMTPVFTWAIERFGWRPTLGGYAAVLAALAVAALSVLRDEAPANADLLPEQVATRGHATRTSTENLKLADALRSAPFWMIFSGLFACGFSMNLLGTHAMPMLMDHGFDAHTSASGIGLIGLVAIFGTIVLGRWSDRLPRRNILAVIYAVRGLGFFALLVVGTHWELYAAASIGGLVGAGSIAMSSAILADVYGLRLVGILYGIAYLGHQIGGMISAWLGGWGYEHFGTHWVAFGTAGALLLLAAAVSLQLPVRTMRVAVPA
jgi:MFS family permease